MADIRPGSPLDQNSTVDNRIYDDDTASFRQEPYVKMLVCGITGIGKSALVNCIFGEEVTKEKDPGFEESYKFSTDQVRCHHKQFNGVDLRVYDSPGLQDGKANEEKYLEDIYSKCRDVDLVLFCMDMNASRFTDNEKKALELFAFKFRSTKFFERCVLVMTKANNVFVPPKQRKVKAEYFKKRYTAMLEAFQDELIENEIPESVVKNIPAVAAGYITPKNELEENEDEDKDRLLWYVSKAVEEDGAAPPHDFLPELWNTCACTVAGEAQSYFYQVTDAMKRSIITSEEVMESLKEREQLEQKIKLKTKTAPAKEFAGLNLSEGLRHRGKSANAKPSLDDKDTSMKFSKPQEERFTKSAKKQNNRLKRTLVGAVIGGTGGGAGGAAAGAATGAAIGALGGPVGAAGGALVGGIVGGLGFSVGGGVYGYKTAN